MREPGYHVQRASLALVLLLFAAFALAAEHGADDRPRIGLVLGGGGARGAAHIGVLRELERMRVPVDAIAGTSMGAIIGGLYATGMDAAALEALIESLDWADALSDAPQRKYLSFRRKQDDEHYPIDFELGLRNGEFLLPKGVIQGQRLELLLRELTLGAAFVTDFDALPIPFRAVTSDIERGEAYVIDQGDLARAIRASMSVPGVLAPVRYDERLLVDGGLVGNLPVEVMQAMDVDVIIAVDVEFPLYEADDLGSALAISEQMLTILIRKETLRQIDRLESGDVLIRPELGLFGSANFGQIVDTIEPGAAAARAHAGELARLALDEEGYAAWRRSRQPLRLERGEIAFVRVEHDSILAPQVFESRISIEPGDAIDVARIHEDAAMLHGLELFESVGYTLVDAPDGTGVVFDAHRKSWGPNFLKFGVSLEDDFEGETAFTLSTRLTRSAINPLGAEWRTDLELGTEPRLASEFYQPLRTDARLFVAPRIEIEQFNLNLFSLEENVGRLRISRGEAGIDFGAELGNAGEFRIGAYRGLGKASVKIGDPGLADTDFDSGGMLAQLRFDTRDSAQFPTRGVRSDLVWNFSRPGFGADASFDTVEAEFASTWSHGKTSVELGLDFATTIESDDTFQDFFPLGGFLRLSGLERGAISGPHSALGRVLVYRRIGSSAGDLFELPIYLGASLEAGNVWQSRSDVALDSLLVNGSVYVGMDTFFGPFYLATGFAEGGDLNFYLFLGTPPR